ncbi:hypothetical protein LDENG_00201620 [Lucifuga dentata]|nr:hypothetical protein LDENG_00201620 [Lucifuga dentata]
MQDKITDLERRSWRNNLLIFGLPENTESTDMATYIERLLKKELEIPEGTKLQIQRAHRVLNKKPPPDITPRSIIVNVLEYEMKEAILKKAWQKKILINKKRILFDHDFPSEVVLKRKAYPGIKKILKEKGIRFQTPLTRIRIHWSSGARIYETVREAALDMKERGYEVDVQDEDAGAELQTAAGWH